jgi:hypothetical protein
MAQKIAFALIIAGFLVLAGWAAKGFFTASEIPLFFRVAVGAVSAGLIILLLSVIRDRLKKLRREGKRGGPRW